MAPTGSKSESCRFFVPQLQIWQDSPHLLYWKPAQSRHRKVQRSPARGFVLQARSLPPFLALAQLALDALPASRARSPLQARVPQARWKKVAPGASRKRLPPPRCPLSGPGEVARPAPPAKTPAPTRVAPQ